MAGPILCNFTSYTFNRPWHGFVVSHSRRIIHVTAPTIPIPGDSLSGVGGGSWSPLSYTVAALGEIGRAPLQRLAVERAQFVVLLIGIVVERV